jgi:hypothetical protein
MITAKLQSSGVYIPSRPFGGFGESTPNLFILEGFTDYNWFDADQEESFSSPDPVPQKEEQFLQPFPKSPSKPSILHGTFI